MSRRSTARRPRGLHAVLPLVLLSVVFAGCTDPPDTADNDGADSRAASDAHGVTFLLSGFDAPDAGADHALRLTIGHLALFDDARNEWVPLLTEPVTTTVRFDETGTTTLATYAVLEGRYTEVEVLADNATVLTPTGTTPATIDEAVCYTRISLDLTQPTPATTIELLVSGAAALRDDNGTWTVRPALVGSLTDRPDDEPIIEDVDCTPA